MRCDSPRPVRVSREARHHPHLHRGVRAIQARCVAPDSQGAVLGSGPRSCPCTWGHGEGTIRASLRGYAGGPQKVIFMVRRSLYRVLVPLCLRDSRVLEKGVDDRQRDDEAGRVLCDRGRHPHSQLQSEAIERHSIKRNPTCVPEHATPTSCPCTLSTGPPLLPGLIGASMATHSSRV